jgi:outer membrane protein assembly factor BamB
MKNVLSRIVLCILIFVSAAIGANGGELVRSDENGWSQFRGPSRDGVSIETGLIEEWPQDGPRLLWKVAGLGQGYSSPIVVDGTVYVTGDVDDKLVIFAYNLAGRLLWKRTNGRAWTGPWPGARASSTYDGGRLFHMNAHGRTVCIDPKTGVERWSVDVLDRFDGSSIKWGLSECLLVDRNRVIVTPGGKKAFMAALDADTGETVWTTGPLLFQRTYEMGGKELDVPVQDSDKAGYASPILFETGGRRLIARTSAQHAVCVDADTGKLVWAHAIYAKFEVIGTIPVFWNDMLFFAAPDTFGGRMFRVEADDESVRIQEMWETPLDNCHGAMVAVDGLMYGAGYRRQLGWTCIEFETGKIRYAKDDLAKGSVVFADGRLYALGENGVLELLKPADNGFQTMGRIQLTEKKRRDVWAHPVIHDGRLYLRDHDTMWCYDLSRSQEGL